MFQPLGGALSQGVIDRIPENNPALIAANGAIDPHTSASYILTKATPLALTLAAPTAGADDGKIIELIGGNAQQHVLTMTNLLNSGAAANDILTWPAAAGGTVRLKAYSGAWYLVGNNLVVAS